MDLGNSGLLVGLRKSQSTTGAKISCYEGPPNTPDCVQLPAIMGAVGCNPQLILDGMPIVGKGVPSRLVVYHQWGLPGALSAVVLMPNTRTAIVVLSNSLALNDCPDGSQKLPYFILTQCSFTNFNYDAMLNIC